MSSTSGSGDPSPWSALGLMNAGRLLESTPFMKNAWASFGVPSALTPTTDLAELDRRIADLKAVEQWLAMNLNLLQTSVQALEVQRSTIATLKAYGESLGTQAIPGSQAMTDALTMMAARMMTAAPTAVPPPPRPARTPDTARAGAQGTRSDAPAAPRGDAAPQREEPSGPASREAAENVAPGAAQPASAQPADAQPGAAPPMPAFDASGWWDLLQRQFHDVASAALAGMSPPAPPTGEGAPVARSTKKTSPKRASRTSGKRKP